MSTAKEITMMPAISTSRSEHSQLFAQKFERLIPLLDRLMSAAANLSDALAESRERKHRIAEISAIDSMIGSAIQMVGIFMRCQAGSERIIPPLCQVLQTCYRQIRDVIGRMDGSVGSAMVAIQRDIEMLLEGLGVQFSHHEIVEE